MPQAYVLVLGAPRSGTTLLAAMIGRHAEVAMLSEDFGDAIHDLVGKRVVGNKLCVPNHIEMQERRPFWIRLLGRHTYYVLYELGYFRYRPEALFSIEDYLQIDSLKLISIVRDGSSVITSIMKRGKQSQTVATYRWCRSIEILYELHQRHADRLLLLSFEQLVTNPEETIQAASQHLELPFQTRMLDGYAYTPNYDNKQIDAERAVKSKRDALTIDIEHQHAEVYRKYEELLAHCTAPEVEPSG